MDRFFSKKRFTEPLTWLKTFIFVHVAVCIVSTLSTPILIQLNTPPLPALLSLSSWGLSKGYYWQLITYLFAPPLSHIDFSLIIGLVFSSYFLWSVGSTLIQAKGLKDFLIIYLGGAFFAGCVASVLALFYPTSSLIAGQTPALYGLLTAWMILVPEMQILLFFTIPIRIKWLVTGVLASSLLIDASNGNYINFILYLSCICFGYIYALLSWQRHSPFPFLYPFEKILIAFGRWFSRQNYKKRYYTPAFHNSQKIYDFQASKSLMEDETFVNECLAKIHREGEKSLSFFEKWKLKKISKRMQRKHPH